jgi:hypothetical protein
MIDILKKIGLFSLVVSGLVLLGNGINAVVNWSWLITICGIFRVMIDPLDFFIDTTEVISSLANFFSILVVFWGVRGFILTTNYFKNK